MSIDSTRPHVTCRVEYRVRARAEAEHLPMLTCLDQVPEALDWVTTALTRSRSTFPYLWRPRWLADLPGRERHLRLGNSSPYGGGVPPSRPGLHLEPMHARDRSAAELGALFSGGWPAFIEADKLAVAIALALSLGSHGTVASDSRPRRVPAAARACIVQVARSSGAVARW